MNAYYPDYKPKQPDCFERMTLAFGMAKTKKELETIVFMYVLDMNYDRQDIVVAQGRAERALIP